MFCVIDTKTNKEYMIGDEMELCLSASKQYKFKCILEDVLENGQIVLGSLQVKVKTGYKNVDGHFKTGVYELLMVEKSYTGRNRYNSLALQYKGRAKRNLIGEGGEIITPGTKITLEIHSEISETTYRGVYTGITDKGLVGMSDVDITGKLYMINNDFVLHEDELALGTQDTMIVEGYGVVKVV